MLEEVRVSRTYCTQKFLGSKVEEGVIILVGVRNKIPVKIGVSVASSKKTLDPSEVRWVKMSEFLHALMNRELSSHSSRAATGCNS